MQTGTFVTNSSSKTKRSTSKYLFPFNLLTLFEKVKSKRTWMKGELDSKILVNRTDKQIVLTVIHEDAEIDSFQSDDSVTLQIIEGKLKLHTRKESINLTEGQLFTLHKKINYRLSTQKEAVFLLTILNEGKRQKIE